MAQFDEYGREDDLGRAVRAAYEAMGPTREAQERMLASLRVAAGQVEDARVEGAQEEGAQKEGACARAAQAKAAPAKVASRRGAVADDAPRHHCSFPSIDRRSARASLRWLRTVDAGVSVIAAISAVLYPS